MKINSIEDLSPLLKENKNNNTLFLFDLDSTLFNVSPRTAKIVSDLCKQPKVRAKFPRESEQALGIQIRSTDWGFKESFIRENFTGSINFLEELIHFWRDKFFSSEYLGFDQLYPEAFNFLQYLKQTGRPIYYLTGRHQKTMKPGTLKSLQENNLPLEDSNFLIMKPERQLQDTSFKLEEVQKLKNKFDQIIFFENEPTIINTIEENTEKVSCIFMNSTHSRKSQVRENIPTLNMDFSPITRLYQ